MFFLYHNFRTKSKFRFSKNCKHIIIFSFISKLFVSTYLNKYIIFFPSFWINKYPISQFSFAKDCFCPFITIIIIKAILHFLVSLLDLVMCCITLNAKCMIERISDNRVFSSHRIVKQHIWP